MSGPDPLVRARSLSAGYGSTVALRDLSCELPGGQAIVVLGPGGSGKSTLLRALRSGVEPYPDLWVRGELEVPPFPLCLLPQRLEVLSTSLRHHLGRTCAPRSSCACSTSCEAAPRFASAQECLEMVWGEVPEAYAVLSRHLDEPLERLAPGLRRLARLTVHRSLGAPLILLDEPEVGLDTQESDWLAQLCLSARRSVSLIVVTHHLGFARTIADYAVLVVDGCLIEAAPAHQFFSSPKHPRTRSYLHSGS